MVFRFHYGAVDIAVAGYGLMFVPVNNIIRMFPRDWFTMFRALRFVLFFLSPVVVVVAAALSLYLSMFVIVGSIFVWKKKRKQHKNWAIVILIVIDDNEPVRRFCQ